MNKYKIWISKDVENYFAASPIGPFLELGSVARDKNHPLFYEIKRSFDLLRSGMLEQVFLDDSFNKLYVKVSKEEKEWHAREWIIIEELNKRIRLRRRGYLLKQYEANRPIPYGDPELTDLDVSKEGLVPLSGFDVEGGVLLRKGQAYIILPTTPSENSSYWITCALSVGGLQDRTWVRLDPMIRGRANKFPRMSYRMLWWGPPFLWKDIVNIKEESFGRWVPDIYGDKYDFTDYAWVLRGEEIHLFIEEIPNRNDISIAGSRYFHVIYSKTTECVVHLDGAVRIYSEIEWDQRKNVHVHRIGKIGKRIKVFRIDGQIRPEEVSSLGGNYFVWNNDVSHFFGASVPKTPIRK